MLYDFVNLYWNNSNFEYFIGSTFNNLDLILELKRREIYPWKSIQILFKYYDRYS